MSKVIPLLQTIFDNQGGSPELWKAVPKTISIKSDEPKYFASYMKTKLKELNQDTQILALDLLDYVVIECKMPLWTQIASKDFLSSLIGLLKLRDAPAVQVKILALIQKWGLRFEKYKEIIPNFYEMYISLKNSGVVFPENYQSEYSKYVENPEDENDYNQNQAQDNIPSQIQSQIPSQSQSQVYSNDFSPNEVVDEIANEGGNYPGNLNINLNQNSYEKKYHKLVDKMCSWFENISLANEMIDNTPAGTTVDDALKGVIENLRLAENTLIETISSDKVKDEKLTEICLGITDDLNRTMTRYELIKLKKKPGAFVSSFPQKKSGSSSSGTTKKTKMVSTNIQVEQSKDARFDIFSDLTTTSNKNVSNQPQANVTTADDLFDIFSSKPKVGPSIPTVNMVSQNISNPGGNQMGFTLSNMNETTTSVPTFNLNNPNEQNVNKKPVDLLAEQLKNIYAGKDVPVSQNNQGAPSNQAVPNLNQGPVAWNPTMMNPMNQPMQMGFNPMMGQPMFPQNMGFVPNLPNANMTGQMNMMNQGQGVNQNPKPQQGSGTNFNYPQFK